MRGLRRLGRSLLFDLGQALWFGYVNRLAASSWVPRALRYLLYRSAGLDVQTPEILSGCVITGRHLSIGANTFVNWGCFFEGSEITIGRDAQIGMQAMLTTADHPRDERGVARRTYRPRPIHIGDRVWLGARVVVLGGVTIAPDCTVAAGAVVSSSLTQPGLYAGVPARLVRPLEPASTP